MPHIPSQDGARLAVVLRAVEWELDTIAHALPTGKVHTERVHGMAVTLRSLADHLDAVSGIVPGDAVREESDDH